MAFYYLASRVSRMEEIRGYRRDLREHGHEVTSRWLLDESEIHANRGGMDSHMRAQYARRDLDDILRADALILFTENRLHPSWKPSGGDGRLVEFGYALANHKVLFVVGPQENLFMCLPSVGWFEDWESFVNAEKNYKWKEDGLGWQRPYIS